MSKGAIKRQMEYLEYIKDLDREEDREFIRQFYSEYYGGEAEYTDFEGRLITSEDIIKEANRNHNSLYKDAFQVSLNLNKKVELTANQREVLEHASDEVDWETALSQGGADLAVRVIMNQFERDIKAGQDIKTVGARLIVKMNRLKKEVNTQRRKQRGK